VDSGHNLSDLAHNAVSHVICKRRLRGGEVIIEAKLADSLGISRTPLREALQRLEGEGLVVESANRSFVVRHVDLAEYLQSLKARELLEAEAASLAVGRIPPGLIRAARREIEQLMAATSYHTDHHWNSDDTVHGLYVDACCNAVMGQMIHLLGWRRVSSRSPVFPIAWERIRPNTCTFWMRLRRATPSGPGGPHKPTSTVSLVSPSQM
jgi:DNA-binding GntR family transcriptional regulator